MPTHITVGELQAMHTKKKKGRRESFEFVLEKCHSRMRTVAQNNALNCFFEVPSMILGLPLYSLSECTEYVVGSLRHAGFLVQSMPNNPGALYISWNPVELNPRKAIAPVRPGAGGGMGGRQSQPPVNWFRT